MKRVLLLSGMVFTLILLGLTFVRGDLVALSIPLVVYIVFGLCTRPSKFDMTFERAISPLRITKDTPISIFLKIANNGEDLKQIKIEDLYPKTLSIEEGSPIKILRINSQEQVEVVYLLHGSRGVHLFSGIRVTAYDCWGMFQQTEVFNLPGEVLILPDAGNIRRLTTRPQLTRVYHGNNPARLGGIGSEFFGVRFYYSGDSLRRINWKACARFPESLFSNDYEIERATDVWLILDARARSDMKVEENSIFEYMISAVAGLSEALLLAGNRVGLLIYGGYLNWTYLGYGKQQKERIFQALARARTGDSLVFDKIDYLPTRIFPRRSQIILFSPLQNEDLGFLVEFRTKNYQVICISPDPIALDSQFIGNDDGYAEELGLRLARVERKLLLVKLIQAGIQVLNWDVREPLIPIVDSIKKQISFRNLNMV